jgi:hypothetical protein
MRQPTGTRLSPMPASTKEVDPAVKAALLKYRATFESVVHAVHEWEAKNP